MSIEFKITLEENNCEQILDLMNTWGKVCADFTRSKESKSNENIKDLIEENKFEILTPAELKDLGFYNISITGNGKIDASFKQYRYFGLTVKKELTFEPNRNSFVINYECFYNKAEKNISLDVDEVSH